MGVRERIFSARAGSLAKAVLDGEGSDETQAGALRRAVGDDAGDAEEGGHGGDEEDGAAVGVDHGFGEGAGEGEGGGGVGEVDALKVFVGGVEGGLFHVDAGVVDEDGGGASGGGDGAGEEVEKDWFFLRGGV
jgi:hypothetical protein